MTSSGSGKYRARSSGGESQTFTVRLSKAAYDAAKFTATARGWSLGRLTETALTSYCLSNSALVAQNYTQEAQKATEEQARFQAAIDALSGKAPEQEGGQP